MVAVEDARTAARRIVEQVIAERAAAGPSRSSRGSASADVPAGDESPTRRAARRIVSEAAEARRGGGATPSPMPAEANGRGQLTEGASLPEVIVDLTDEPVLAGAPAVATSVNGDVVDRDEPLADQLFVREQRAARGGSGRPRGGTADGAVRARGGTVEDTVPTPIPEPGPAPDPDPGPVPDPNPGPWPDPEPGPWPDPEPGPPDPQPSPTPPDPEPEPLPTDRGPREPTPEPSPERRRAEETARRIVEEVVGAYDEAAARAEHARLTERAVVVEETRLFEEAWVAEETLQQEIVGGQTSQEAGPYLEELPHPDVPVPPVDGPPPIPDAARRVAVAPPAPEPARAPERVPTSALTRGEARPPRTGRWLITTIVGALALALLFPLAVAALRSLVTLSG